MGCPLRRRRAPTLPESLLAAVPAAVHTVPVQEGLPRTGARAVEAGLTGSRRQPLACDLTAVLFSKDELCLLVSWRSLQIVHWDSKEELDGQSSACRGQSWALRGVSYSSLAIVTLCPSLTGVASHSPGACSSPPPPHPHPCEMLPLSLWRPQALQMA